MAGNLTSSLFLFLDHSHDHILDSILKAQCISKSYWKLCNLVLSRVLRDSPGHAISDLTYIRFIFAFKMWKTIVKGGKEKKNIVKLAVNKLHPPSLFRVSIEAGVFSEILPDIPKSKPCVTTFLMKAKFCIKDKIREFLKQITTSEKFTFDSGIMNIEGVFLSKNISDDGFKVAKEEQEVVEEKLNSVINKILSSSTDYSFKKVRKEKKTKKCVECKHIVSSVLKNSTSPKFEKKQLHQPNISIEIESLRIEEKHADINSNFNRPLLVDTQCTSYPSIKATTELPNSDIQWETQEVKKSDTSLLGNVDQPVVKSKKNVEVESDTTLVSQVISNNSQSLLKSRFETTVVERKQYPENDCANNQFNCSAIEPNSLQNSEAFTISQKFQDSEKKLKRKEVKEENLKKFKNLNTILHYLTLKRDFKTFIRQKVLHSNLFKNMSYRISGDLLRSTHSIEKWWKRCSCDQCRSNCNSLQINFQMLTKYIEKRQAEYENSTLKRTNKTQITNQISCLPFKKRRTQTLAE